MNTCLFHKKALPVCMPFLVGFVAMLLGAQAPSTIQFGCAINAQEQIRESQALAKSIASPGDPQWRAKGDLHRKYHFPAANAEMPYRLYVPMSWDGKSRLPLVMILHGAGSDENWYVDANGAIIGRSVCWLYCWAKTGMGSQDTAEEAQRAFFEVLDVSFDRFDAKVNHEWARQARYARDRGPVDAELARLLG